jgi:alanine dehydrogenase
MLHLDAQQLASRLPRLALIDALERAFRGETQVPARQFLTLDPAGAANAAGATGVSGPALLLMPAWRAGGAIGVKMVTVFPDNGARGLGAVHAAYTLFDAATGVPLATMDGSELTHRRTGAASALAARYLAMPQASRLVMVGTGALAPHVIASHAAVRPIREVRIWGRTLQSARQLAVRLRAEAPAYSVDAAENLEEAVRWADVISCATLATSPLVRGEWLREGQHLDLIGSFRAAMREADNEALRVARCLRRYARRCAARKR